MYQGRLGDAEPEPGTPTEVPIEPPFRIWKDPWTFPNDTQALIDQGLLPPNQYPDPTNTDPTTPPSGHTDPLTGDWIPDPTSPPRSNFLWRFFGNGVMSEQTVNDVISAHLGWAKGKASYFHSLYCVDFDDVYSYALESIWDALLYQKNTEEGCTRNLEWFATVFLRRKVIDLIRHNHTIKCNLPYQSSDFDKVCATSVTYLTGGLGKQYIEPREPCLECGTTGGASDSGRSYSARCHGLCLSCYWKSRRVRKLRNHKLKSK